MPNDINGKIIVVTGGAGLLGKPFCKAIVEAGGIVIIAEKNEKAGKELADEINSTHPDKAVFVNADVISDASLHALIQTTHNNFGCINALVNAVYPRNKNYGRRLEEVTYHDFMENVGMHVGSYLLASRHFLNYFSKQGAGNIVNIASVYGVIPPRFDIFEGTGMNIPVEYSIAKAGIVQLTRYISRYYRNMNIRCNAISPGGIKNNQPPAFVERYNSYANNKGLLDAQDLCGTLIYLLSDASAYVNGQNIIVDDGWSL